MRTSFNASTRCRQTMTCFWDAALWDQDRRHGVKNPTSQPFDVRSANVSTLDMHWDSKEEATTGRRKPGLQSDSGRFSGTDHSGSQTGTGRLPPPASWTNQSALVRTARTIEHGPDGLRGGGGRHAALFIREHPEPAALRSAVIHRSSSKCWPHSRVPDVPQRPASKSQDSDGGFV